MHVLIACERSGVVRRAFEERGHDAWSCDLEQSLDSSKRHIVADAADVAYAGGWDLMIAHPPCTHLSYAGARWWHRPGTKDEQQKALNFFYILLNAPIAKICIENPRGLAARYIRKPDDVVEPFMFGDRANKRTYLWLKNLPPLMSTYIVPGEKNWVARQHGFSRSITFAGIAAAMADQYV